jgi:regulatory protein
MNEIQFVIETVKAKKSGRNCVLLLDNGEELECSKDIVLKHTLIKGRILTQDELERIINEQRIIDVKQTAYNFVSYKPRTEKQVRIRLDGKGFSDDECETALNFLREFDLINDERYAESFIKDLLMKKPASESKIMIDMLKRGIPKSIVIWAIHKIYPVEAKYDMAVKAAAKKMKVIRHKPLEKRKDSLIRYLLSLGYEWDLIKRVVNDTIKGLDLTGD